MSIKPTTKKLNQIKAGDIIQKGFGKAVLVVTPWYDPQDIMAPPKFQILPLASIPRERHIEENDDNILMPLGLLREHTALSTREKHVVRFPMERIDEEALLQPLFEGASCLGNISRTPFFRDINNIIQAKVERGELNLDNALSAKKTHQLSKVPRKKVQKASIKTPDVTLDDAVRLNLIDMGLRDVITQGVAQEETPPRLKALFALASSTKRSDKQRLDGIITRGLRNSHMGLMDAFDEGYLYESVACITMIKHGVHTLGAAMTAAEKAPEHGRGRLVAVDREDLLNTPPQQVRMRLKDLGSKLNQLNQMIASGEVDQAGVVYMYDDAPKPK